MRRIRAILKDNNHNAIVNHEKFDNNNINNKTDILINCTGIGYSYPIKSYWNKRIDLESGIDSQAFDYVVKSHVLDCYQNILQVVENDQMRCDSESESVIINLTSYGAFDGWVGEAAFSAGCRAICDLTENLSNYDPFLDQKLKDKNIRLNTIAYNWLSQPNWIYRESHHWFHREISRNTDQGHMNYFTPGKVANLKFGEPFVNNPFLLKDTDFSVVNMISQIYENQGIDRSVITLGSIDRMNL